MSPVLFPQNFYPLRPHRCMEGIPNDSNYQNNKSELMLMRRASYQNSMSYQIPCWKFHTQVVLVYLQPFRRNSPLKCVPQPKNAKKFTKIFILRVQGHSRSSTLTFLRSSSPVLVMISSMSVPICNHFHVGRANRSRITLFKGCLCFAPSFAKTPFTQGHEILSRNTRDPKLSYGENPKFLSHPVLERYRDVTDRRTDRQTELP